MDHKETMNILERIIDSDGVAKTLRRVGEICALKADHIQSNWQDETLANQWAGASKDLDKFASKGYVWCL